IVKRKGKQVRPMFVLFSAKLFGDINQRTYRGASLVELLHTATLVHDDVVDESYKRRGFFSINALWKNKVAVLVGDFLLSKGLLLSVENKDFDLLEIVSDSVRKMSEGELLQLEKARKMDITEVVYYDIITKKTASLIASCCAIGAAANDANLETIEKMRLFGEYTGIAFQIKDDLFDYGDNNIGKPTGIDIKEKKMTLPLIYALQNTERSQKKHIINLIKNSSDKKESVREVIDFVMTGNGFKYATEQMEKYKDLALQTLNSIDCPGSKDSLRQLIDFVIERKK
ncbi:MAG: polyprenyl synthetase family protein, partial [Bacteroidia bacterium]|nr:polyprenyl synthetase family protein [Bacteroidia bacterium]